MRVWSLYRAILKEPNMVVLLLSQIFGFAAAPVSVFLGGMVGASLSEGALYATFPVSMFQLGQALGSPGAAALMSRSGRRVGSMLGSLFGVCMAILASYAVWQHVFTLYVMGMYAPSLVTGAMIQRFGDTKMLNAGLIIYFFTVLIGWLPPVSVTYALGMIALGVCWNFLFVTSTTKLAAISRGASRFRVQGVNDFFVFLLTACASFMAGSLVQTFSWGQLHTLCLPLLVLIGLCIFWGAQHSK